MEHKHLVNLLNLERLDIEGPSVPTCRNDAAIAIANMLQSSPMIHDLHIRSVNQNI
jgi:hypothetical protein